MIDVGTYFINGLQVRAESTMNAEYSSIHDRAQCQIIEHLATPPPNI